MSIRLKRLVFASVLLSLSSSVTAASLSEEQALTRLQQHYDEAKKLTKVSLSLEGKRPTLFQSDDYRKPATITSYYHYQYDLLAEQFYFHDQHIYPGNFIFDKKIVHKQDLSILYDVNGFTMGKQLEKLDYNLDEFVGDTSSELSLLAAAKFLSNMDLNKTKVLIKEHSVELETYQGSSKSEEKVETYEFSLSPIRLVSITQHKRKEKTVYTEVVRDNGFSYASEITRYRNGQLRQSLKVTHFSELENIDASHLEIPQGYGPFVDTSDTPLEWVNLTKDLYLINYVAGDRHVLVKESKDGLTIFGAPASSEVSEAVHALIQEQLPDKPIQSVYITHAHSDHMRGLAYYADKGIKVIADKYAIAAIKIYPSFAKSAKSWAFIEIHHKEVLDGVTFYRPNNSHSKGQTFAYFPAHQIIYQGDFLEIPFDNSIPSHMADVEKEFIDFIRQEKIPYQRIVGHHRNNNMRPDVVNLYYETHHGE